MALLRTPLHPVHERLGGRLVPFAGYEMPVMFAGILDEHATVRSRVGLFDVSHMSNLWVSGPDAAATLSRALTADATKIPQGGTKYACILNADGTIMDDLYVFHVPHGLHVVPNAGKNADVAAAIRAAGNADVKDVTAETAILALQGPQANATLAAFTGRSFDNVKRFHVTQAPDLGTDAFISRTGYTGEDGFELFVPATEAVRVYEGLLKAGETFGIAPCGLGARDTLRLEKGYCLAGHEFAGGRTPLEASLSWLVDWNHDFVGKDALVAQKEAATHDRLVGIKLTGRGIPREGNVVATPDGDTIGVVTSGTQSPNLKEGIALAYVARAHAKSGTPLAVTIRDKAVPAEVVKLPFV